MQGSVDANAPLDYIELETFLSQNRYDAYVRYLDKTEKVTSGLLEHLLHHFPQVKALHLKGSNAKYKINPPENSRDVKWFTKTTLIRFLHILSSENLLKVTNSLKHEISQLDETRRFQLSLYAKDQGSDASKNELLRAMDLRLNALREQLTSAFDQAAGSIYSFEEILNLEKFSHHIGAENLRDLLHTHRELRRQTEPVEESKGFEANVGNEDDVILIPSEIPINYGVSPAIAAQVERRSSNEGDESSLSSDEDKQPTVERSRSLVRSASPRRSSSPMRRVQIGRSGSRRPTAIAIKSLTTFPSRDKSFFPRDSAASNSDEEEIAKKTETNVKRMSVQDAINLFENKQKNQTGDVPKAKPLSVANRSVLRRWSSGMGEDPSLQCCNGSTPKDGNDVIHNGEIEENMQSSEKVETEHSVADGVALPEPCRADNEVNSSENVESSLAVRPQDSLECANETTEVSEKVTSSAEWNRQKEAELNELLMKMMEAKPVRGHKQDSEVRKRQSLPSAQKGELNDNYKEKRDVKLQAQAAKKRTDGERELKRTTQKTADARKSQPISANAADEKRSAKKIQRSPKTLSQQGNNSKATESPKLGVTKKSSIKGSSLPSVRQSWPSNPQQKALGTSPASTPSVRSSSVAVPTRRKSQTATTPVSQLGPKVDHKSQPQPKTVIKPSLRDTKKAEPERKLNPTSNPRKISKEKVQTAPEDVGSAAKPSLYSKFTKKSSVVPLESKPFLRKGAGKISNSTTVKKNSSSATPRQRKKNVDILILDDATDSVSDTSDQHVVVHEEVEIKESTAEESLEFGITEPSFEIHDEKEEEVVHAESIINDDGIQTVIVSEDKTDIEEEEDNFISPTAWEIEEHEDLRTLTSSNDTCKGIDSHDVVTAMGASSPRVRHSLSQMLLQESIESDAVDWGNAENPPPITYQKDAPKGLKRLLKFARKSKTDASSSGWSSPSVFSEGEDDADDSKSLNRRSSDNLLKKATLHSMNNGYPAQANTSKMNAQSLSQQFQETNVSSSITTTKATRSFFSLSAFKGGK